MIPAARRALLVRELSMDFALRRGLSVYMDGSHNPTPSETRAAERFIEIVESVLDATDEEFQRQEAQMGYPIISG